MQKQNTNKQKRLVAAIAIIMCIAGVAAAIAYSSTVINSGNESGVDGMDIGFFSDSAEASEAQVEIDNGDLLQGIQLDSVRQWDDVEKKWVTQFVIGEDKSLLNNDTYIHAVEMNVGQVLGNLTITMDNASLGNIPADDIGTHLETKFGETAGTITFAEGVLTIKFLSIAMGSTGNQFIFQLPDEATDLSVYTGFKIGDSENKSTVTAVFQDTGSLTTYEMTYVDDEYHFAPPMEVWVEGSGPYTVKAPMNEPEGKALNYWDATDGNHYEPGELISNPTEDVTFTAVWRDLNPSVNVSFNLNEGSGVVPEPTTYAERTPITLPGSEGLDPPEGSPAGTTLLGWGTNAAGPAEYAVAGEYIVPENDVTLYAIWGIANPVTVTFIANGGSNPPGAITGPEGSSITLPDQGDMQPPSDELMFVGWSTDSAGPVEYDAGATYVLSADVDMYAIWAVKVTVTFDANGGSNPPEAMTGPEGSSITLPYQGDMQPPTAGMVLAGWSTDSAGSVEYDAGETFDLSSTVTLYAIWGTPVTVTFEKMGAGGTGPDPISGLIGETIKLPEQGEMTPPSQGFVLLGWSSTYMGTADYAPGADYTLTGNVTLWAVWGNP